MDTVRAWLEYNDERGLSRKLNLPNEGEATPVPGLKLSRKGAAFHVQEIKPGLRLTLNGRSISRAKLKHLDTIQYGARIFIFHATAIAETQPKVITALPSAAPPKAAPPPASPPPTAAPPFRPPRFKGHLLFPWDMLFLPKAFWQKALPQRLFSVGGNSLFILCHGAALAWFPLATPHRTPVFLGGYALVTTVLFAVTYMCAALLFGFRQRQLSSVLHFTFYVQPFVLAAQNAYKAHPAAPAAATALFLTWQSAVAFRSGLLRSLSFGTLVAIPWCALMTGVMYFLA